MMRNLEYPLSMFFEQLYWAWINWNLRPEKEENKWHGLVTHFAEEIAHYFEEKKAAKRRPLDN